MQLFPVWTPLVGIANETLVVAAAVGVYRDVNLPNGCYSRHEHKS